MVASGASATKRESFNVHWNINICTLNCNFKKPVAEVLEATGFYITLNQSAVFIVLRINLLCCVLHLSIIFYLCRNLVRCKKHLKGNPVKIRNRPAAVSSISKFLKSISTVFFNGKDFKNGVSQKTCRRMNV